MVLQLIGVSVVYITLCDVDHTIVSDLCHRIVFVFVDECDLGHYIHFEHVGKCH